MRREPQLPGRVVLRTCELAGLGISPDSAERAVLRGAWQRPATGVYVAHDRELTAFELGQVAAAYARGPHVVSGFIPLHLRRLRWLPPLQSAQILVPDLLRRPSSRRVVVTRTTQWERIETWSCGGLRLAQLARAVADAGRSLSSLRDVRGVVLGAVADGHATVADLRGILDVGQRNGSRLVRRALVDADRGCASPPEAELVDELVGRGVPFLVNPEVWLNGVLIGCPDVWIVGTAVTGEVESVERHGDEDDRTATYDRHEQFVGAGLDPVHLAVRRIRRNCAEAASYLLKRARDSTDPVPAALEVRPKGPLLH